MKHMKQNGFGANHLTSHDKQNGYIVRTIPEDWGWNWDDTIPIPRLSFSLSALIVAIISVICFINCYDGDFVFDDSEAVVGNQDILPTSPLLDLFSHDFWGNKLDSKTSHKSYRPLTVLTFRYVVTMVTIVIVSGDQNRSHLTIYYMKMIMSEHHLLVFAVFKHVQVVDWCGQWWNCFSL